LTQSIPSLVELLRHWGTTRPERVAYVTVSDRSGSASTCTFAELLRRVEIVAERLRQRGRTGDRAVLLCPHGLEFIVAFLACLCARIIAVPMMLPRRHGMHDVASAIIGDCTPRFALTTHELLNEQRSDLADRFGGLEWVFADEDRDAAPVMATPLPKAEDIAFLQYTSGSIAAPKGVMVSHAGVLANLEMIREVVGLRQPTYVSWLPLYHDMGLIANVLQSLYVGSLCVLLSPAAFIRRPLTWLRVIHDYRGAVSGAPNFAFDLCVSRYRPEDMADIDLSCWEFAFNAAEPVQAETIARFIETFAPHGFSQRAMRPSYGLAEATVLASTGRRGSMFVERRVSQTGLQHHLVKPPETSADEQSVIGCGRALHGEELAIVDPASGNSLGTTQVGEIFVSGVNVAEGYWGNRSATAETFEARIHGRKQNWCRTGDLGFIDETGELYITGRIKEVIIIRGINHYPQDIENTVQNADPTLRRHGGAAFAATDSLGNEGLVIVQEVERTARQQTALPQLVVRIREAIVIEHDIAAMEIVLIRTGTLPKTTSGKIQRTLTRQLWMQGDLVELPTVPNRPEVARSSQSAGQGQARKFKRG
jgi:acyl-CoA synthetase (AMP-forming)/AMP-acid ligase II